MSADLSPGHVRVKYGTNVTVLPGIVGMLVAKARASLKDQWGIDPKAQARIDGRLVANEATEQLTDQSTLEFVKPLGEKAMDPQTSAQVAAAAAAKLLVDQASENLRREQQAAAAEHKRQLDAAVASVKTDTTNAINGVKREVTAQITAAGEATNGKIAEMEGRILTSVKAETKAAAQTIADQAASKAATAAAAAVQQVLAANTPLPAPAPTSDPLPGSFVHTSASVPPQPYPAPYPPAGRPLSRPATHDRYEDSDGEGGYRDRRDQSRPRRRIGFNPKRMFQTLLVTAVASLAVWGGNRGWAEQKFTSDFQQYVSAAQAARQKGDMEKAKKYCDRATAFLDNAGLNDGRTDVLFDAGPEADVAEWRADVDAKLKLIAITPPGKTEEEEAALRAKLEPRSPPGGLFTGVATYPANKNNFYWFLGSCVAVLLAGMGLGVTRKRKGTDEGTDTVATRSTRRD